MKNNMIRILGFGVAIIGAVATVVGTCVEQKRTDEKINEEVNRAFAERETRNEES